MITTHVQAESQSAERVSDSGNGRIAPDPSAKSHLGTLHRIWGLMRGDEVIAAIGKPVMVFHDWISDPPMTERDRNKLYIIETRKASKRRRLAGR